MSETQWRCPAGHATQRDAQPPYFTCGCSMRTATDEAIAAHGFTRERVDGAVTAWDAVRP